MQQRLPTLRWLSSRRRRLAVLAGGLVLAAGLFPGLLRLRTDNSPEVFFVRGSPAVERYLELRQELGGGLVVRLVANGEGIWTAEGLEWLARLEREAAALPGVASVSGLFQHHARAGWPPADIAAFRQRARTNRLDRSLGWISADGSTVTAVAVLEEVPVAEQRRLFDRLRGIFATAPPGVTAGLVGLPLLNHALDDSSREIDRRYFPLLALFGLVVLLLTVRDIAGIVIPLVFVGFCELLALAPMGYAGIELNMVLAMLPPLVFVIALATALHVLLRFRDLEAEGVGSGAAEICRATYREKGWPVLWTGLTTLVGFASLALSPVGPVRSLGLWAGFGLGLMTVAAFTIYPAMLALTSGAPPRHRFFEVRIHRLGARWGRWAHRRRRAVLLATAAVAVIAIAGWPRIRVESNALHYLAADHPVRSQIEQLQAKGIGVATLEVLITPAGSDRDAAFADPERIAVLAVLGDHLETEPLIYGAMSVGALLRDAMERTPRLLPGEAMHRALTLQGIEADPDGRRVLAAFLSDDRRRARVSAFVATAGSGELEPLLDRVRETAGAVFPAAAVEVTGEFPMLLEAQRHLTSTLAVSLCVTLLAVALILRFLLPGTRLTLLALLPNLWPVVGMLGAMGWLDVPLDIATVMVASVVLGLAVDDTLHTLGHFRLFAHLGARAAVARTLEVTAPAYLLTGVILAAGFGVCALSDFAPIARFGTLSAFAILLAVLGDLFLLPALLSLTPRKTLERWVEK